MRARAIFFDAHGVLYYRPTGDARLIAFLDVQGLAAGLQAAKKTHAHLHDLAMRGQVKLQDYRLAVLKTCGVRQPDLLTAGLAAMQADQADIALFAGVVETIRALKARKRKIGIITDAAVTKLCKLSWIRSCGLRVVWDAYANSMDLGTRKPDPLMYHTALEQARINPYDSVFVGHAAHELNGAHQVGLTTVAFNPDPGAEADYFIESFSGLLDLPLFRRK